MAAGAQLQQCACSQGGDAGDTGVVGAGAVEVGAGGGGVDAGAAGIAGAGVAEAGVGAGGVGNGWFRNVRRSSMRSV